jgi:hypothetical protein
MEITIAVGYNSTPEVEDRIAVDNELISLELDAMHGWNADVVHVDRIDLPNVDHLEAAKVVTHEVRITYIQT